LLFPFESSLSLREILGSQCDIRRVDHLAVQGSIHWVDETQIDQDCSNSQLNWRTHDYERRRRDYNNAQNSEVGGITQANLSALGKGVTGNICDQGIDLINPIQISKLKLDRAAKYSSITVWGSTI